MKKVMGVSIGSSRRDHRITLELLGEEIDISRQGTDGDFERAVTLLRIRDGFVDAFGIGGLDLSFTAAGSTYVLRDGRQFRRAAHITPMLDGGGLKGAIEGDIARFMQDDLGLDLAGKRVLMTSAIDRWGMSMGFEAAGCQMTYGDMLYALGIPLLVRTHGGIVRLVHTVAPLAVQLPFSMLYPYEADHTSFTPSTSKYTQLYRDHKIIAGDFKFVEKFMPQDMRGKWIVTNTTTEKDVEILRGLGVELLITTTPRLEGRSFGTNIIEAALVAIDGSRQALPEARYREILDEIGWKPDVIWLQES